MSQQNIKPDVGGNAPWEIRLPFALPPQAEITFDDAECHSMIGGFKCSLKREPFAYILKVFDFPEQQEAEDFVRTLGSGLMWTGVTVSTGITFSMHLDKVKYFDNPQEAARNFFGPNTDRLADCAISGNLTAVYPSTSQVVTVTGNPVSIRVGVPSDKFFAALDEGVSLGCSSDILANERICLACDLFSLSHFESSLKSRFVSQMAVLEVLAERPSLPEKLINLVEGLGREAHQAEGECTDPEEKKALGRLRSRISDLKRESITESVRILVKNALVALGEDDVDKRVGEISYLYNVRSKIAHGNQIDLGQAPSQLQDTVRKTLRSVMAQPDVLGLKR